MAAKSKASAKSKTTSTKSASREKTVTKTAAKRTTAKPARKPTAAKATAKKPAAKKPAATRTRRATGTAASAKKPTTARTAATRKKATATKTAAKTKVAAKATPSAAKKTTAKSAATAAKKTVAKKAPAKAAAKKPTAAKATAAKTTRKTAAAKTKKPAAKSTTKATTAARKPTRKQTAAARKAVLSAAAKKFQVKPNAKAPNVSGSTRAAALAAQSLKPKQAAVRALAAANVPADGKKVSEPMTDGPDSPKGIAERTAKRSANGTKGKAVSQRHGFKTNEYIVYPAHGVGKIIGIEEQEIAGMALELFVIHFEKEKLTLRVPTGKLESVGMRKLSEDDIVTKSMTVLKGRARIKRTMWSRRAQEYIAKINSGDLIQIAEVVRDLYRSDAQPEQSYSERQLYEDALDRMAREVAAVEKLDERGAVQRITEVLSKSARTRRAADEAAEAETEGEPKAA